MPFQLRHIDELADELGKSKAQRTLDDAGIRIINGYYDHGALDALRHEPKATNIGKRSKGIWTLAETDGVGAMKAVLDRVNLDIVRHLYHSTNYLTVRNKRGKRRQVKVYSTSRARTQWQIARFSCSGFLDSTAPSYYMFICYEGPIAWTLSQRQLIAIHKKCKAQGGRASDGFHIPKSKLGHKRGMLHLSLEAGDEQYLLTSAKQLGL
jgi:hypothetical protein